MIDSEKSDELDSNASVNVYESVYLKQILFENVKDGIGGIQNLRNILRQGSILGLVNAQEEDTGMTALHYACQMDKWDELLVLLEAGADAVGIVDKYGHTALHKAAQHGHIKIALEVLKYFPLECFDGVSKDTLVGMAASHGQARMLKALLDKSAGFHERNELGETALHLAAKFNHPACIRQLAAAGADLNAATHLHGHTPFHYATMHGNVEAALALQCAGADLHKPDTLPLRSSPLEAAKDCGHWRLYNMLLKEDRRLLKVEFNKLKKSKQEAEQTQRELNYRTMKARSQLTKIATELSLKQELERNFHTNQEDKRRRQKELELHTKRSSNTTLKTAASEK